jgi:hypothetical protein
MTNFIYESELLETSLPSNCSEGYPCPSPNPISPRSFSTMAG